MLVKLTLKIYQKSKTIMLLQILFLVIRQQKTKQRRTKHPFVYDTGPMESKSNGNRYRQIVLRRPLIDYASFPL